MKTMLYVLAVLVVLILVAVYWLFNGMSEIKKLEISDIDLSKLADGVYSGSFRKGRWNYKVAVTIKDHAITGVEVLSRDIVGKISQEEIARVVSKQSLRVDAVSGATVFSKALLKAIENALVSAPR